MDMCEVDYRVRRLKAAAVSLSDAMAPLARAMPGHPETTAHFKVLVDVVVHGVGAMPCDIAGLLTRRETISDLAVSAAILVEMVLPMLDPRALGTSAALCRGVCDEVLALNSTLRHCRSQVGRPSLASLPV